MLSILQILATVQRPSFCCGAEKALAGRANGVNHIKNKQSKTDCLQCITLNDLSSMQNSNGYYFQPQRNEQTLVRDDDIIGILDLGDSNYQSQRLETFSQRTNPKLSDVLDQRKLTWKSILELIRETHVTYSLIYYNMHKVKIFPSV